MSIISSLFSNGCNRLENVIRSFGNEMKAFSQRIDEQKPFRNLEHKINQFERVIKIEQSYITRVKDFNTNDIEECFRKLSLVDELFSELNGKKGQKNKNNDPQQQAEEFFNKTKDNLLKAQVFKANLESEIRVLAQELFSEKISKLEISQIKEYLYKNWN